MNINELSTSKANEEGAPLRLNHPVTGEDTGIVIYLLGADSKPYRESEREFRRRAMKQQFEDPIQAAEDQAMRTRVACTVGWEGVEDDKGPIKCNADNCRRIYGDDGLRWITDRVDAFIKDRTNFLPRCSKEQSSS